MLSCTFHCLQQIKSVRKITGIDEIGIGSKRVAFLNPTWHELTIILFVGPRCFKHQRKVPNFSAGNEDAAHGRILAYLHTLAIWAMEGSALVTAPTTRNYIIHWVFFVFNDSHFCWGWQCWQFWLFMGHVKSVWVASMVTEDVPIVSGERDPATGRCYW